MSVECSEKEAFWRLVLDEHRKSDLTIRDFCRTEGLSEPSFYAWRRTIASRDQLRGASSSPSRSCRKTQSASADSSTPQALTRSHGKKSSTSTNKATDRLLPVEVVNSAHVDSAMKTPRAVGPKNMSPMIDADSANRSADNRANVSDCRIEVQSPDGWIVRMSQSDSLDAVARLLQRLGVCCKSDSQCSTTQCSARHNSMEGQSC